jgi:hypothetical protein
MSSFVIGAAPPVAVSGRMALTSDARRTLMVENLRAKTGIRHTRVSSLGHFHFGVVAQSGGMAQHNRRLLKATKHDADS